MNLSIIFIIFVQLTQKIYKCANGGQIITIVDEQNYYNQNPAQNAYNNYSEGTALVDEKWYPVQQNAGKAYDTATGFLNEWVNCQESPYQEKYFYGLVFPTDRDIRRQVSITPPHYDVEVEISVVLYGQEYFLNTDNFVININDGTNPAVQICSKTRDQFTLFEQRCTDWGLETGLWDENGAYEAIYDCSILLTNHSTDKIILDLEITNTNYNQATRQNRWGINNFIVKYYQCDDSCLTCQGSKPNECLTCTTTPQRYRLADVLPFYNCYQNCPSGYYDDNTTAPVQCTVCNSKCIVCYDSTENDCNSCNTGYHLVGNSCILTCTNNCLTCQTIPENASFCLTCETGYFFESNSCYSVCPAGFYGNTVTMNCDGCTSPCDECSSPTDCYTCVPGNFLLFNQCLASCPAGRWENSVDNRCDLCDSNCLTCVGSSTFCDSCDSSKILINNVCQLCDTVGGFMQDPNDLDNCIEICGDGIRISTTIECDDGNIIDGDGCSYDCKIEKGYECEGGSIITKDICIDKNPIRFKVINIYDEEQVWMNYDENEIFQFHILFEKQFEIQQGSLKTLQDLLKIQIEGSKDDQNWKMSLRQDTSNDLLYIVDITLETSIRNGFFFVSFSDFQLFTDTNGNTLQNNKQSVFVKQYFYYSDEKRESLNNFINQIEILILFMLVCLLPLIMMNKFWILQMGIDHMHLIYLLGFINYRQCINAIEFQKILKKFQTVYLPNYFDIDSDKQYNSQNLEKFLFYDVQTQFLQNAGQLLLIFIVFMIFYLISKIMYAIAFRFENNTFQTVMLYIIKGFFEWGFFNDYFLSTISLFTAFAGLNFIGGINWSYSTVFSIIISIIIFFTPFSTLVIAYMNKDEPYEAPSEKVIFKWKNEAENLGFKFRNFWQFTDLNRKGAIYFIPFFYLRKIIYGLILSLFYGQNLLQLYLVVIINGIFFLLFLIVKPYKRLRDNIRVFLTEVCIFVALGLTFQMNTDEGADEDARYIEQYKIIYCYAICLIIHDSFIFIDVGIFIYYYIVKQIFCPRRMKVVNLRDVRGDEELSELKDTDSANRNKKVNNLRKNRKQFSLVDSQYDINSVKKLNNQSDPDTNNYQY